MPVVDPERSHRVQVLRSTLESSVSGSTAHLIGSLAAGTADAYSDIDLQWRVGDGAAAVLQRIREILAQVAPVTSLRFDPELDGSGDRRLAFVRFTGWPLFSRVDLEIIGDFVGAAPVGEWSAQESALMNVIGAMKAGLREQPDVVDGLLARGFHRIGAVDPGGSAVIRMESLTAAAAGQDPAQRQLAATIAQALTAINTP